MSEATRFSKAASRPDLYGEEDANTITKTWQAECPPTCANCGLQVAQAVSPAMAEKIGPSRGGLETRAGFYETCRVREHCAGNLPPGPKHATASG